MTKPVDAALDGAVESLFSAAQSRVEKQLTELQTKRKKIQEQRDSLELTRTSLSTQAAELDHQITLCVQQLDSIKLMRAQKSGILYP